MLWTWFLSSCTEEVFIAMVRINAVRNIVACSLGPKWYKAVYHLSNVLVSEIGWFAVLHSVIYIFAVCKYRHGCAQVFPPLSDIVKKLFVCSLPIKIISKCLPFLKRNIEVALAGSEPILFLPSLFHQGKQNSRVSKCPQHYRELRLGCERSHCQEERQKNNLRKVINEHLHSSLCWMCPSFHWSVTECQWEFLISFQVGWTWFTGR